MALKDEVLSVYQEEKARVRGNYFVLYPGQVRQRIIAKREAAARGWFQNFFLARPSPRQIRKAMHELRLTHPHLVRLGGGASKRRTKSHPAVVATA